MVGVRQWAEIKRMAEVEGLSQRTISRPPACIERGSPGRCQAIIRRAARARRRDRSSTPSRGTSIACWGPIRGFPRCGFAS